jgi:hypothetical protein
MAVSHRGGRSPAREITSRHRVDRGSLLPLATRREAVATTFPDVMEIIKSQLLENFLPRHDQWLLLKISANTNRRSPMSESFPLPTVRHGSSA